MDYRAILSNLPYTDGVNRNRWIVFFSIAVYVPAVLWTIRWIPQPEHHYPFILFIAPIPIWLYIAFRSKPIS